ncbi:MAG TPA: hypothetical protein VHO70_20960 [Chitinispirillaceae bacterium]|nr:hypothetical protein [Chitinispirillaceae bacterium]
MCNRVEIVSFKQTLLTILLLLCSIPLSTSATSEDLTPFFDTLESSLRQQYIRCTGDSSEVQTTEIRLWKKKLQLFMENDSFPIVAKSFFSETGLSPEDVYLCELINWYQNRATQRGEYAQLLADDLKKREIRKADSLKIVNIYKNAQTSPFDFNGIPFGLSKENFLLVLEWKTSMKYENRGKFIQCSDVPLGSLMVAVAFHFDKDGYYRMCEIECNGGTLDSINTAVRDEVTLLGKHIESTSGIAPDHTYRIGRFDITQGRLTVERLWSRYPISAFVGIATYRYHYYGKAVIVANCIMKAADSIRIDEKSGD